MRHLGSGLQQGLGGDQTWPTQQPRRESAWTWAALEPREGSVSPEGTGGPAFASEGRARPLQEQATLRTRRWEPRFTETPTRANTSPSGAPR